MSTLLLILQMSTYVQTQGNNKREFEHEVSNYLNIIIDPELCCIPTYESYKRSYYVTSVRFSLNWFWSHSDKIDVPNRNAKLCKPAQTRVRPIDFRVNTKGDDLRFTWQDKGWREWPVQAVYFCDVIFTFAAQNTWVVVTDSFGSWFVGGYTIKLWRLICASADLSDWKLR